MHRVGFPTWTRTSAKYPQVDILIQITIEFVSGNRKEVLLIIRSYKEEHFAQA
jgi:hypothetical protein